mgnify:CR=1 FL=1
MRHAAGKADEEMRKEEIKKRQFARSAALAAVLALACAASGCGARLKYDFPVRKTFVYSYTESRQVEKAEGEFEDNIAWKKLVTKARVAEISRGGTTIVKLTAHPPEGEGHATKGRSYGDVEVYIDRSGRHLDMRGSGMPPSINLYHLLPELPKKRMRRRAVWKETSDVKVFSMDLKMELTKRYLGRERVNSILCHRLEGAGRYEVERKAQDPESGSIVEVRMEIDYKEELWFAKNGYPVKLVVTQNRVRKMKDTATGLDLIRRGDRVTTELMLMGSE